jgi:peptide/nickel transport system permease protein
VRVNATELQLQAQGGLAGPIRAIEGRGQWRLAWRRLRRDKAAMAGAAVIVIMAALALAAPAFAALTGHGPAQQFPNTGLSATGAPAGPGRAFWLGADDLGRDLFVRILYGARISLFVGVVTTVIGTVLGVSAGLMAGYFGGWTDLALSRLVDAVLAFPYVVLALALAAVLGPSLPVVIGVISFFTWAGIARVVRGQAISLREREYIEAARSLGAGPWRIMFTEILPNLVGPVLVLATLSIPSAIIFEATLSFLGLGVQPPTASWGNILAGAQNDYSVAWWYLVFPALALLITTLAFNILGDGIRDALDPGTPPPRPPGAGGRAGAPAAPAAATGAPRAAHPHPAPHRPPGRLHRPPWHRGHGFRPPALCPSRPRASRPPPPRLPASPPARSPGSPVTCAAWLPCCLSWSAGPRPVWWCCGRSAWARSCCSSPGPRSRWPGPWPARSPPPPNCGRSPGSSG